MGVTKFVEDLIISSKSTANGITAGSVLGANIGSAVSGEVYLVDSTRASTDGNVLDATAFDAATMSAFSIVPIIADGKAKPHPTKIKKADIIGVTKEAYSAPVTKVVNLGYNGTTGDLALSKGTTGTNEYAIISKIITDTTYNDLFKTQITSYTTSGFAATTPTNQEKLDYFYNYLAEWNGTSSTITTRLFREGSESIYKYTDLQLVYNTASAATGTNITATYGSYNVTTSTAHGLVAGDYVKIGASAASANITGTIYKVDSAPTTTSLVLTTPFKGTSLSAVAGAMSKVVTTGTPTFGFIITVKPNATPYTKEGGVQTFNFDALYSRQDDNVHSTLVDSAALKTVTEAKWSAGHVDSVKDHEWKHLNLDGVITRYGWGADYFIPTSRVSGSVNYDLYTISYRDTNVLSDQNVVRNTKMVSVYLPTGSAASTNFWGIIDSLTPSVTL